VDGIDIDVTEINRLAAAIDRSAGQVGARGARVVRDAAVAVQRTAKEMAPAASGRLRRSISYDMTGDGRFGAIEAEVGPTVFYAGFVEWGTSTQPPRAFTGPALDRCTPDFIEAIEQLAEEAL
jgi:HK97 gp10 family phage protein